ncbi:PIN domain-containing protein [Candidatus Woesearchaeota archaeon]|nr:PIN domain-containing protein [Candidatus Woesearchaeota archaeon]
MILDTSFVIDFMQNEEGALRRHTMLLEKNETYRVSSATIFELWSGIAHSKKSKEERLKVTKALAGISTVILTVQIAEKAGELHGTLAKEGQSIDELDAMIAATAIQENESLLTRNVRHFAKVKGLKVETY